LRDFPSVLDDMEPLVPKWQPVPTSSNTAAGSAGPRPFRGSLVDLGIRTAFKVAHRVLRTWWFVRRPHTRGALVAVWCDGEIMLVKNSYRRQYTLPGGYIRSSETPSEAGARELAEEVGIDVHPSEISVVYSGMHPFEFRDDEVTIVELEVAERPAFAVDNREVVWAGFMRPEDVLRLRVIPHLREYLKQRQHGRAGSH
jgi:8-oxo-dGTP diphosphatase